MTFEVRTLGWGKLEVTADVYNFKDGGLQFYVAGTDRPVAAFSIGQWMSVSVVGCVKQAEPKTS